MKWAVSHGTAALCIALFVLGYGFHSVIDAFTHSHKGRDGSEQRLGGGTFTNPLLECDIAEDSISSRKIDFTPELATFSELLKTKYDIQDVGIYFRDLNNGPIVSIKAMDPFVGASLLKVPIMLEYLSRAESDPTILQKMITYTPSDVELLPDQHIVPDQSIVVGKTYSVQQLIEYMIKYSDNNAMALLYKDIPLAEQVNLYQLLGVDPAVLSDRNATISVKQYSVFFRVLFNASYLSRAHSEWALKLLSESTFTAGLRAGVPANIPVAHKFGERQFDDGLQQLHDCGIVYYPAHPYLLCIMTRGTNTHSLEKAIADTSAFVYQKIDAEYNK